jgi:hypothetical protein
VRGKRKEIDAQGRGEKVIWERGEGTGERKWEKKKKDGKRDWGKGKWERVNGKTRWGKGEWGMGNDEKGKRKGDQTEEKRD